jgi:hypothetical protein
MTNQNWGSYSAMEPLFRWPDSSIQRAFRDKPNKSLIVCIDLVSLTRQSFRYPNQQLPILRRHHYHDTFNAVEIIYGAGLQCILMRADNRSRSWPAIRTSNDLLQRNIHRQREFLERL